MQVVKKDWMVHGCPKSDWQRMDLLSHPGLVVTRIDLFRVMEELLDSMIPLIILFVYYNIYKQSSN